MLIAGQVGQAPHKPARPTLIFDGNCGFCAKWVKRMKRLDRDDVIWLLPLQDSRATELSGQPRERLEQAAHLVRPDGAVFAGAAAAREAFRYLRGGRAVGFVATVPGLMPVAERVYAWVARRWGPVAERS
jgi:predicted DCC family thiol-disulfide oxidoreductase YuxK